MFRKVSPTTYLALCILLIIGGVAGMLYVTQAISEEQFLENSGFYSVMVAAPIAIGVIMIKVGVITGKLFGGLSEQDAEKK